MATLPTPGIEPAVGRCLLAGLISGVIAAVINNLYALLYTAVTGNSQALINPVSIAFASLIPLLLAGAGYYLVVRFIPNRATLIFVSGTLVLAALSLAGPFGGQLPDGAAAPAWFPVLSAPMHVAAGLVAAYGIPRVVVNHRGRA